MGDEMMREQNFNNHKEVNVLKGLAAGMVAGLVAGWTMNQFQKVWTRVAEGFEKPHGAQSMQPSEDENTARSDQPQEDDATVEVAEIISENVFGRELKESEKKEAGAAVHYSFSVAMGGFYGVAAELAPAVTAKAGLPFGAAFWFVADEVAVPLLGLSKGPSEIPISTHVYALSAHLVYGLTAESTRRAIRRLT